MTEHSRHAVLAVLLAAMALLGVGAVAVGAQTGSTVSIDGPASIEPGSTDAATLQAADVVSAEGVGAYEINLTYDPSLVSISAGDAGAFTVETGEPADGVLRLVGYTGDVPGPNGTVPLASLDVTGEAPGTADVGVTIESLTDTDGDELPASSQDVSLTIEKGATETPTPDDTTDTPQSGNGGAAPGTSEPSEPTERHQISDDDPDTPGATVRFSSVAVSEITFDAEDASGEVEVRDLGAEVPDEARDAPGSENVARAVEITVPDSANGQASIRIRLPTEDLDGTDPANARVARFVDGEWQDLETRLVSTNGETVLEADTPGFSYFAVMKGQDATPTPSTATETATAEPGTSTPETDDDSTPTTTDEMTTESPDATTQAGPTVTATPSAGGGVDLVWLIVILAVVLGVVLAGLWRAGKL